MIKYIAKICTKTLFFLNRLISFVFPYRTVYFRKGKFKLKVSTNDELQRFLTFENKEPETLRWIDSFDFDSDSSQIVFYDIGANVGIYSLYASYRFPKAKIFAFEPDSQSFSTLVKNIHINGFKILPFPFALTDTSGVSTVSISSMNSGAGACSLDGKYFFTSHIEEINVFEQGIFFTSLDDLIFKYTLPIPKYIKIDVDGIELKILNGATNLLKSNSLKSILVEFQYTNDKQVEMLIDKLESFGFVLSQKSDWVSHYMDWNSRNFIFSRS